jgi:hypothetical protein
LTFSGQPQFIITNKLLISDCVWNFAEVTNTADNPHFFLNGGLFNCSNMMVTSFNKIGLRILKCDKMSQVNCEVLIIKDVVSDKTGYHFDLIGETNFADSVYYFWYFQ